MTDILHFFCVSNDSQSDPNRKFYVSAPTAYAELDRREGQGVHCSINTRDEWDRDTMRDYQNLYQRQGV